VVLRLFLLALSWAACVSAAAQASASAVATSDYRFRGVSLSADRPALQGDLGWDFAAGAYLGIFASNVRFYETAPAQVQGSAYAGYARALDADWSVDAGATYGGFSRDREYDYGEAHAGVAWRNLSARLSWSPNYFGQSLHTWYAELDGAQPLGGSLRAVGHAGLLWMASGECAGPCTNADARAGAQWAWRSLQLQVARVLNQGSISAYPVGGSPRTHGAWVAQLAYRY